MGRCCAPRRRSWRAEGGGPWRGPPEAKNCHDRNVNNRPKTLRMMRIYFVVRTRLDFCLNYRIRYPSNPTRENVSVYSHRFRFISPRHQTSHAVSSINSSSVRTTWHSSDHFFTWLIVHNKTPRFHRHYCPINFSGGRGYIY